MTFLCWKTIGPPAYINLDSGAKGSNSLGLNCRVATLPLFFTGKVQLGHKELSTPPANNRLLPAVPTWSPNGLIVRTGKVHEAGYHYSADDEAEQ